jgi:two-component system sensor histidine kinase QseC
VSVVIDDALDAVTLNGDPDDLKLVLRNLNENALEHVASAGRITWYALLDRNGVAISDEGPGVDDDELPRIIERFYRGRNKSASGTGLGLTIATMAAARLGAILSFRNRSDRQGLIAELQWHTTSR